MTVRDERWSEIAALSHGELREISYPTLLSALARTGRTVTLELTRQPVTKRVLVVDGVPIDCRSNLAHETFGRFLVATGKLSEQALGETLAESLRTGIPLGEILLERQLLPAAEIYRQLKQNLARKLLDGFTWKHGRFRLVEEPVRDSSTVRVNVARLLLTGVLKLTPPEEVERGAGAYLREPLALNPAAPLGSPRLQGAATQVVDALANGPLEVEELTAAVRLPAADLQRAVYALGVAGLVLPASLAAGVTAETGTVTEPRPPASPRPAAAPAPPDGEELLRLQSKILEAYLCFRRKDAYDLLRLPEEADREAVEAAYLEAARTYSPWTLEELGESDYAEMARTLFFAAAEAFGELRDPERRGTLLHRRKVLREERDHKGADLSISTDLLDPDQQYRKGVEIRAQGDLKRALEYLQFAADCDPQNAVYRAEAAYCSYELSPGLHRERTLAELREAVRIEPRCGLALYYLGVVLGREGRATAAEEVLRRSIKLMAPDRRPIDALRELKSQAAKRR